MLSDYDIVRNCKSNLERGGYNVASISVVGRMLIVAVRDTEYITTFMLPIKMFR